MMFDQLCIAVHLAQNPTSFERSNWETQKHIERLQQYFSMWTNIKQGGILKTKRLSQEINWTFYLLNRCKSNNLHINVMFLLCFIKKTLIYIDHERLGFVKEKSGISLVAGDSGFLLSFLLRLYLLLFLCEIYKLLDLHIKLFHAILDIYIYVCDFYNLMFIAHEISVYCYGCLQFPKCSKVWFKFGICKCSNYGRDKS